MKQNLVILPLLFFSFIEIGAAKTTFPVVYSEAKPTISRGTGYVYKSPSNEVVFLQSTTIDALSFNKAIVVALESDANITIEEGVVEQAEIYYDSKSKRSLIIHSKKNNLFYLFGLDEKASLDKLASLQQNQATENSKYLKVLGFGLSVLNGNWNKEKFLNYASSSAFEKLSNSSNLTAPPGTGGDKKCTSGGEGAKECSITEWTDVSCSVSCNDGYYACCNSTTTTCVCVKNPPPKKQD